MIIFKTLCGDRPDDQMQLKKMYSKITFIVYKA